MNCIRTTLATNELLSDRELICFVRDGDTGAFALLSDRYAGYLKSGAGRYAGLVGMDAEDLIQEGLIALFRATGSYTPESGVAFRTYAVTCIHNAMKDCIRSYRKRSCLNITSMDDLEEHRLYADPMFLLRPVEEMYMECETSKWRTQQIETLLSHFEQQVLQLYLGCHTYQQIAQRLNTSTKAVDNALQRVRRKLRPEKE